MLFDVSNGLHPFVLDAPKITALLCRVMILFLFAEAVTHLLFGAIGVLVTAAVMQDIADVILLGMHSLGATDLVDVASGAVASVWDFCLDQCYQSVASLLSTRGPWCPWWRYCPHHCCACWCHSWACIHPLPCILLCFMSPQV
jgi:hypothetical protein